MNNLTKRQKNIAVSTLAIAFLAGCALLAYFILYSPAHQAKLQSEQLLQSERELLMNLQAQQKAAPPTEKISIRELQQKVSILPSTDAILLEIEEAELISETLVTSVSFEETTVELLQPIEGLENLHEVITTVEFNALDYESITAFVEEIETMERIMIVEALDFASNPEVTELDQELEPLTALISFAAYYRPDLTELDGDSLKVDAPAPAGKFNPFPQNDGTNLSLKEKAVAEEVDIETQIIADNADSDAEVKVDVNVESDTDTEDKPEESAETNEVEEQDEVTAQ